MNNEYQRLQAVNRFKNFTAGIEHDLDNIVTLISQICETPASLITVIDEHTQWFKAKSGVDFDCNEREFSFCNTTIQQNELLIVPDLQQDERFAKFPLVAHEPHVRFYAGMPLTTYDGQAIGTLCVLDTVPRELNEIQKNALRTLSKQVLNVWELNWSLRSLNHQFEKAQKEKYSIEQHALKVSAVYNGSKDIQILLNRTFEVLVFNKSAANYVQSYFGLPLEQGKSILEYVNNQSAKRLLSYFNNAIAGVTQQTEWQFTLNGKTQWLKISFADINNDDGVNIGILISAVDITQNKKYEVQVNSQNAALQRIATLQSFELRKPVASLMGIVELLKDEPALTDNDYVSMMAASVKELDNKILDIVKDAESTIYSKEPVA